MNKGDSDEQIAQYSLEAERVIVSYDPDWVEAIPEDDFYCALVFEDQSISTEELSEIIHTMSKY